MHLTNGLPPRKVMQTVKYTMFHALYIIMHQALNNKILEQFYDKENPAHTIRPTRCKREGCSELVRFHMHDSYRRKAIYRKGIGWVVGVHVQRFRCVLCGKVFSLIPPNHYKWQRADHVTQQDVALGQHESKALLENFSTRTLHRWRQKWKGWAEQLLHWILQWLLRMKPGISLDASASIATDPLRYLGFLLGQFSENRHSSVTVTAVSRFGGWSMPAIPQCLSVSLPMEPLISCQQGQAP